MGGLGKIGILNGGGARHRDFVRGGLIQPGRPSAGGLAARRLGRQGLEEL